MCIPLLPLHDGQMSAIRRERRQQVTLEADSLRDDLTPTLQRAMNLAHERGSSSWLTSLPIKEHGFCLHNSAFVDALALRYAWLGSLLNHHDMCVWGQLQC